MDVGDVGDYRDPPTANYLDTVREKFNEQEFRIVIDSFSKWERLRLVNEFAPIAVHLSTFAVLIPLTPSKSELRLAVELILTGLLILAFLLMKGQRDMMRTGPKMVLAACQYPFAIGELSRQILTYDLQRIAIPGWGDTFIVQLINLLNKQQEAPETSALKPLLEDAISGSLTNEADAKARKLLQSLSARKRI